MDCEAVKRSIEAAKARLDCALEALERGNSVASVAFLDKAAYAITQARAEQETLGDSGQMRRSPGDRRARERRGRYVWVPSTPTSDPPSSSDG